MRAVVQRVREARVEVDRAVTGSVGPGLLVYLGVGSDDNESDLAYVVEKVRYLRVFCDADGRLNLDVVQVGGDVLVVSAFTVHADARRGRRPSFESAARPDQALALYEQFCERLRGSGVPVSVGSFGAMMQVYSVNDGPICVLLDSKRQF